MHKPILTTLTVAAALAATSANAAPPLVPIAITSNWLNRTLWSDPHTQKAIKQLQSRFNAFLKIYEAKGLEKALASQELKLLDDAIVDLNDAIAALRDGSVRKGDESEAVIQKVRTDLQQLMEPIGKSFGDLKISPSRSAADGSVRTLKIGIRNLVDSYAK